MDEDLKTRLLEKLGQIDIETLQKFHVILLPDFFVDHFLTLDEFENTFEKIKNIYGQGGGNFPGVSQMITPGGNASNTALALARLGISTHLISRTSEFGLHLLEYFLGKYGVDLKHVKTDGELSITTALEFGETHTNIMIGDVGSVSNFSFDVLNDKDLELISNSDMVCVLCWNLNQNGTDLAKKTFRYAKQHNIKTFFDTGDPSPRTNEITDLMENVLSDDNLDIFSLNENELRHYSNIETNSKDDIVNAAISLKKKIPARIDLHTSSFTCTVNNECKVVPTPDISQKYRTTGAGDTWNAGNILGELLGFNDDERLLFAGCVACRYISSPQPIHPDLNQVIKFISDSR